MSKTDIMVEFLYCHQCKKRTRLKVYDDFHRGDELWFFEETVATCPECLGENMSWSIDKNMPDGVIFILDEVDVE